MPETLTRTHPTTSNIATRTSLADPLETQKLTNLTQQRSEQ